MLRSTSACLIGFAVLAATASAGTPKLTATVTKLSPTSRVVRVVNHDRVAYRDFMVVTIGKPAIIRATGCGVERDGGYNGLTFVWKHTATCKKRLPPGRGFDIRLTTTAEKGNVFVYVVVNGVRSKIS